TDESTDPDGDNTIVAWDWEFGDGGVSTLPNPAPHPFAATALTVYTIRLTVTDDQALTSTKTQQITISPPATFTCGTTPDCGLTLTEAAVVTVTLTSASCTATGNTFVITEPVVDTLFTNGCSEPPAGTSFTLNNGAAFTAGTEVRAEVISGSIKQVFLPALQVTGSYPTWTVKFDDGEGGPGEPDFNDLEFTITATP
ncbi:MAG: PKD domain-containing protein, partial [Gemmatimonadales bacterium]